ncbi:hypothetical protein BDD12DRAFT_890390 [Trichophaea hybrida]|nr:hypothetical protein BDD12DRAFT_890390 [Trichophaea hybrida]
MPLQRQPCTWPSTSNWTKENIASVFNKSTQDIDNVFGRQSFKQYLNQVQQWKTRHNRKVIPAHSLLKLYPALQPGEVKTYDQEFVDIMISITEETTHLLGITPHAAFIDDDHGAMGRMVSCLLRQETRNAAKAGNTPTKPKPPAEPVALSLGPSKSKPTPLPKPSPKSGPSTLVNCTTNVQVDSSSPGLSGSRSRGGSAARRRGLPCHPDLPCHMIVHLCQLAQDSGRSSVKRYASSSPALSVSETSRTQRVWKAAAIDLLIEWHESDLLVDHDPAPVSIKDFMHEPGAPTTYEELAQFITEQFHLAEFTRNSACTIAEIGGRLFIAFNTAPETIPMDDSDIDVIYVKTTINPNLRETPIAMKPDSDEDLEDPLRSIISIAPQVINRDDVEEDEELAPEAAPVNDDEPEFLPITDIATPSTPDVPPVEPVD